MNPTNSINPTNAYYEEDEIDLLELWNVLWRGKWFIIGFTFICAVAAIAYALLATPYFQAEVVMAPVEDEGGQGGLGGLAAQYGGLASLAGINLGGGSSDTQTHLAILQSREFLYRFFEDNQLLPVLFERLWDKEKKAWIPADSKQIPTLLRAYRFYTENVMTINQDKTTGIIKIAVLWKDPQLSSEWANDLVNRINAHIREKTIREAQQSIAYLEAEIAKTSDVAMREVLYRLVEKQTQTITLAQVREQAAFHIIDPAVTPEFAAKPKKKLIVVLGTAAGGFAAIFLQFFRVFIRNVRNRKEEGES